MYARQNFLSKPFYKKLKSVQIVISSETLSETVETLTETFSKTLSETECDTFRETLS